MKAIAHIRRLVAVATQPARTIALAAILALATSTGCDRSSEPEYEGGTDETTTIARLKSRCTGSSAAISEDIAVKGTVTGNDHYGEFYKMLVIEDGSGGISIAVDGTKLYADYPVGTAVEVYCNGLVLYDYGGKIQLGTQPSGEYAGAGRIPAAELPRYLRSKNGEAARVRPRALGFDEVGMRHIDTYVHFGEVCFAETGNWCDTDPETGRPVTTERLMKDAAGQEFLVRTSGTCTYATEPVPQGTGSVYGIIDYFNGKYTLRITNREVVFATVAGLPTACP